MSDKKLKDELLGEDLLDHNYDGIMELDNDLPPWWLYMFYGTIAAGAIYLVAFFGMGKFDQIEELNAEYAVAEEQIAKFKEANGPGIDESSVVLAVDAAQLEDGKTIYTKNCVACHAVNGGGGVGPNFTDETWIHGSSIKEVFKVIKAGRLIAQFL